MRDRYKKSKYYPKVVESIGRNYERLYALCCHGKHGYFDSRSYDDIFQDAIIYVCQDPAAKEILSDADLISHFVYRYRMIEFQTMQDVKQLKEIPYADYLQAKEEATEDR